MSTPAPRDLIRLSIRDNGTGMDAATLAEIFQPFFTTKPSGTGTGLGLAAVHGIVTAYGGAIRVESEAGVGTQFDVFLPAADGSVEPVEETEELVVTGNRRGRILVVDDEVDLAAVICAKLQNLGHDAVECHHPHKAWTLFRSDPHGFDLLFTDQTMPGMAGDQLAEALRVDPPGPARHRLFGLWRARRRGAAAGNRRGGAAQQAGDDGHTGPRGDGSAGGQPCGLAGAAEGRRLGQRGLQSGGRAT